MALRRPDSDDSLRYVPNPLAVDFNVEAVVARLGHRREALCLRASGCSPRCLGLLLHGLPYGF